MLHSQFTRIETKAGGVAASNRAFIKAARTLLSSNGRSAKQRDARKAWLREALALRVTANKIMKG
jgi:hypothetical protein